MSITTIVNFDYPLYIKIINFILNQNERTQIGLKLQTVSIVILSCSSYRINKQQVGVQAIKCMIVTHWRIKQTQFNLITEALIYVTPFNCRKPFIKIQHSICAFVFFKSILSVKCRRIFTTKMFEMCCVQVQKKSLLKK